MGGGKLPELRRTEALRLIEDFSQEFERRALRYLGVTRTEFEEWRR